MKRLKYYLKLLLLFIRFSLMAQMEYRLNFVSSLLVKIGYLLVKLSYVAVIYSTGVTIGGLTVSFTHIAGFILFTLTGVFLTYCMFLIPKLLSFWFVSTSGISQMTDALWDFNNMPMNLYSNWIQKLGTFIIPIFVITNSPGLCAMDRLTPGYVAWGFAVPFLAFALQRAVFKRAVRHYTSASS